MNGAVVACHSGAALVSVLARLVGTTSVIVVLDLERISSPDIMLSTVAGIVPADKLHLLHATSSLSERLQALSQLSRCYRGIRGFRLLSGPSGKARLEERDLSALVRLIETGQDSWDDFCFLYAGQPLDFRLAEHGDHISQVIRKTKTYYEIEMLEALSNLVSRESVVVDVGANIGNHTVFFASSCGAKVISFEPNPKALTLLERNVSRNGQQRVRVFPVGLGSMTARAAVFDRLHNNLGAAALRVGSGDVEVRTMDDVLGEEERVDLIKVDVEGMETDVLLGGSATIRKFRPFLVIEAATRAALDAIELHTGPMGYERRACFNATPTYLFVPTR